MSAGQRPSLEKRTRVGRKTKAGKIARGSSVERRSTFEFSFSDGEMSNHTHLTNEASKGQSGRVIALNKELRKQLIKVKQINGVGITDADRSSHTAMPGC